MNTIAITYHWWIYHSPRIIFHFLLLYYLETIYKLHNNKYLYNILYHELSVVQLTLYNMITITSYTINIVYPFTVITKNYQLILFFFLLEVSIVYQRINHLRIIKTLLLNKYHVIHNIHYMLITKYTHSSIKIYFMYSISVAKFIIMQLRLY